MASPGIHNLREVVMGPSKIINALKDVYTSLVLWAGPCIMMYYGLTIRQLPPQCRQRLLFLHAGLADQFARSIPWVHNHRCSCHHIGYHSICRLDGHQASMGCLVLVRGAQQSNKPGRPRGRLAWLIASIPSTECPCRRWLMRAAAHALHARQAWL